MRIACTSYDDTGIAWQFAVLYGLPLPLAMAEPGLAPLAPLFPAPLLKAIERAPRRRRPWLFGWLAGMVCWVIYTHWVISVMHHDGGLPQWAVVFRFVGKGAFLGMLWDLAVGFRLFVDGMGSAIWRAKKRILVPRILLTIGTIAASMAIPGIVSATTLSAMLVALVGLAMIEVGNRSPAKMISARRGRGPDRWVRDEEVKRCDCACFQLG